MCFDLYFSKYFHIAHKKTSVKMCQKTKEYKLTNERFEFVEEKTCLLSICLKLVKEKQVAFHRSFQRAHPAAARRKLSLVVNLFL